jgi:hypothetical protein
LTPCRLRRPWPSARLSKLHVFCTLQYDLPNGIALAKIREGSREFPEGGRKPADFSRSRSL